MAAFPEIEKIQYEGPDSTNPLAFRHYDADAMIEGRTMREHLRFSVVYWHTFRGAGADPFGPGCAERPWELEDGTVDDAVRRAEMAFEFIEKLGAPYYAFHDRDVAPEGDTLRESNENLDTVVKKFRELQDATGIKLLWGTANLFSHPRYMNGAATNPDFDVVAYAGSQVKAALDATIKLGGENYVFWGGREGYSSLLNTNMKRELDHLAMFLSQARDYGRNNGFSGTFLIEPKPMEPSKHQYDFDVAAVAAFLKHYDLDNDFKINIENNHATLAGHTFDHEIQAAYNYGLFGSLDINQGDPHNGWDTDEFLHNIYDAVHIMLVLLEEGGLKSGGMNFDAKTRRNSTDLEDIFIGHINSMDTLARGLMIASKILEDPNYKKLRYNRYSSFDSGDGHLFEQGEVNLEQLTELAQKNMEPEQISGKQELYEMLINKHIQ